MTQPFARHTGGELMDETTFSELSSRAPGQRVYDLAELGARVVSAPAPPPRKPARPTPPAAPRTGAAPRPAAAPARPAALEAEIDRCNSREAVGRLSASLARSYAAASALLLVHRGIVQGLCAEGLPGRPDALLFPVDAQSVFGEVARSGRAFRGAPRPDGLDARILRALGRAQVREIAVLPIRLGSRVVNLLYADNGPEPLGDAAFAALGAVCTRVADAYARLIRARKRDAQA